MVDDIPYEIPDSALVPRAVEVLRSRLREHGITIYVSGIDGSGKTTLARALVDTLVASGVQARHLHMYQWYLSVMLTPVLLLYNRYVGRKVLVFDRGIYDNISVLAVRECCPKWLSRAALDLAVRFYPKFDYHWYLISTFSDITRRRPDTRKMQFEALGEIYDEITLRVRCVRLRSNTRLFGSALRDIVGEA